VTALRYEVDGPVATITLARPDRRNAIDPEMSRDVHAALERIDEDRGVRAGVLTGEGEVFCAGADLKAIAAGRLPELLEQPGGFCGLGALRRRTPLVAALNGHALAGGCELALACDIVVAAEDAELGLPEVSRGIIAGAGGVFRLALAIPPKRAMEMLLTGQRISAREAQTLGLVNRVVPAGDVLAVARDLARRIADQAPLAVQETRAIAEAATEAAAPELWRLTGEAWTRVMASPDAGEGAKAFAERRDPVWVDPPT
jgi:enoyl-CoA hydratase/carnithine racemase